MRIKYISFILVILAFILSAACSIYSGANVGKSELYSPIFSVSPKIVTKESTLRINLPKERPANLAIQSPEGSWYTLQYIDENISFISEKAFRSDPYLDISVTTIKGVIWVNGVETKELVFQSLGTYTIYMADNLETEPENTFSFITSIELKP